METMSLELTDSVDPGKWDDDAERLGGGFYHCYAGVTYMAERTNAQPLFVRAVADRDRCVGLAGGYVARSRIWPFSRVCGRAEFSATPVAGGDVALGRAMLVSLEAELRRRGVYAITFASYHSPNSAILLPEVGYKLIDRYEYDFDLTRSLESLFQASQPQKRREKRRAEREGVVTREVSTSHGVETVIRLHNAAMDRRGVRPQRTDSAAVRARENLLRSGRARVLVSYMGEEAVGAHVYGCFNSLAYGLIGGSSSRGNESRSLVHLVWTAIELFQREGYRCLSLGGAKADELGLRKFKQEFGAVETPQPAGSKVLSRFGASLDRFRSRLRW